MADRVGRVSAPLAVRRGTYRQALAESLQRVVAHLANDPSVERILLFGSYARGKEDLLTDLDLIVVKESALGFTDRIAALYREVGPLLTVDTDILVYTPSEWASVQNTPFGRHALNDAKVLYEKRAP